MRKREDRVCRGFQFNLGKLHMAFEGRLPRTAAGAAKWMDVYMDWMGKPNVR